MNEPSSQPAAPFLTTRWTRVCLAKEDSDDGRRALADLCEAYYAPVVAFLSYDLRSADLAQDMAHSFFAEMLSGGTIRWAQEERGRFRSYLLGAVKNFLSHQRVAEQRWKRGGKVMHVSLDDEEAAQVADAGNLSPDAAYDRQWALTLLGHAMDALREECKKQGREEFFELVQPWLTGSASHGDQVSLAERCGMTPAAFKMAIQRMKHRFRQCVKEQVAGTLTDPSDLAQEMESLGG
jgi:DNA-directed RNA polymerase specialized sigma24 family protein